MAEWSHFDRDGNAVMVDVTAKEVTARTACASGTIRVNREVMDAVCWGWHRWPGLWRPNRPGR